MRRYPELAWWISTRDLRSDEQATIEDAVQQCFRIRNHLVPVLGPSTIREVLQDLGYPFAIVEFELNRCVDAVEKQLMNYFLAVDRFSPGHPLAWQIKRLHIYQYGGFLGTIKAHPEADSDDPLKNVEPPDSPQQRLAL